MGMNISQKLIKSHLVSGEMTPGRGNRHPHRPDFDPGRHRDAGDAGTGSDGSGPRENGAVGPVRRPQPAPDRSSRIRTTTSFWRAPAGGSASGSAGPATALAIPCTCSASASRARRCWAPTATRPAAGAMGMLAIGAGGLEVAMAMAGEPFYLKMPQIWGVKLMGQLPDWVSAKDVILEMLRRHDVDGGVGWVIEYYGPGLESLSAMDRHVIANMGTELGATVHRFPVRRGGAPFLRAQGRDDGLERAGRRRRTPNTTVYEEIDLASLEPLIAMPSALATSCRSARSPGATIYQAYIGSSANPGYRDFAVAAEIVKGRQSSRPACHSTSTRLHGRCSRI